MLTILNLLYPLFAILTFTSLFKPVDALGNSCTAPLGTGNAATSDPYWLETLTKRGTSAFNANPSSYPVRRNVKDFGAKGDGVTDDTAAINAAISAGSRCGNGDCQSSTLTPALVYFPSGTYLVSSPIISWYYTQLVGDAKHPPTLLASASFTGIAVIDADVYIPGGNGAQWYVNQNNFFREVRNFVIDLTRMPATSSATGLHWQVSQATSLYNIVVHMSTASDTAHQGIFIENGSGGFMGDLAFNGGKFGIWVGNQQFTVRNITVNNAQTGIFMQWNWGWTFQGVTINNCQIGFQITTGRGITSSTQTAGAEAIIDATVIDTPILLETTQTSSGSLAGSLLLDNVKLSNVPTAVKTAQGITVFAGPGTGTITQWAQGNIYSGSSGSGKFVQTSLIQPEKPSSLLQNGKIASRTRPQYETFSTSQIVSVKAEGAKGDGNTDDTSAIQAVIDKFWGCKIIFFDAGTYVVSDTITIPAGTIITGEVWPVILGTGSMFQSQTSPHPVVQVGAPGSIGTMEITDIMFSTRGPTPGAIVVEWNVKGSGIAAAAAWDTHIRLGSAQGTNLGSAQCVKQVDHGSNCFASFMGLHLTPASSAYIEGMWVWNGDHDLDGDNSQVSVFSGRGILSESAGPVWLIGTTEHHTLYQYSLVNAADHYLGLIQTESPYYQPSPAPPGPFSVNSAFHDPTFPTGQDHAWALNVQSSNNILVYGAGLYSFFQNYNQDCTNSGANNCQQQILNVDTSSSISIYSLSTVGTTFQLSVNRTGVINQVNNINGFQSTVTAWTRNAAT
ncbi:exo-beta-1,3-glucanase [Hysterangium stoloniferum]|nr:exo-beta-1,3-glucanase [Hysterangium stoloniferum]